MTRYVRAHPDLIPGRLGPEIDLPPGHHHVHVNEDGTITAVPMRERCSWCGCEREFHDEPDRRCGVCNDFCVYGASWVDASGETPA